MYLIKIPLLLQYLKPEATWRVPTREKIMYLTFDDGPIPEVTPAVLSILKEKNVRATFFCVGENVVKHPEIYKSILADGHSVGNHTFNHLNGKLTDTVEYVSNIKQCAKVVDSKLFRPPYGKMKSLQSNILKAQYHLIYWDVLSGDFDRTLTPERCLKNVLQNAKAGSIVVFHDSKKAEPRVLYSLPRVIDHFAARGFAFAALSNNIF